MREDSELRTAIAHYRRAFVAVAGISAILNVLLLGGSIFMMMVYDSVLPSHSVPTLVGLLLMLVCAYVFQGYFDAARARILGDVGGGLERRLSARVQQVIRELSLRGGRRETDSLTPMRDLDALRSFLGGSGPATAIDLPWIGFFLGILFLLHPWLGVTALAGALVMIGLTWLTHRASRAPMRDIGQLASLRYSGAEANLRHAEVSVALGMHGRLLSRWEAMNQRYLAANDRLAQNVSLYGGSSKIFRLFLQSALLSVGALLVIDGKASGGIIFASSIIAGRALAPIDQAIANWRAFAQARTGWQRLGALLAAVPERPAPSVRLPAPTRSLAVRDLCIVPPGSQRMTVMGITFALTAGDVLGVIGPSAAGKSSLVRALVGAWLPARGTIALDGATLDQWEAERLGASIGYLPQAVELIEGTIAENIARFDPEATSERIIAAARAAGVHDLVVRLPGGYETAVGRDGTDLSAGQCQRIGLARALYGQPFLVVLDEPNSNLDSDGEDALEAAIAGVRARGGIVIVIAHRPAALTQASHILMMRAGAMESFGLRQDASAAAMPAPLSFPGRTAPMPAAAQRNRP